MIDTIYYASSLTLAAVIVFTVAPGAWAVTEQADLPAVWNALAVISALAVCVMDVVRLTVKDSSPLLRTLAPLLYSLVVVGLAGPATWPTVGHGAVFVGALFWSGAICATTFAVLLVAGIFAKLKLRGVKRITRTHGTASEGTR